MQSGRLEASENIYKEFEQRMQREAYEGAGSEAYRLGVPRNRNPFLRKPDAYSDPADQQRLQRLAEHWWNGWDAASAKAKANARRR